MEKSKHTNKPLKASQSADDLDGHLHKINIQKRINHFREVRLLSHKHIFSIISILYMLYMMYIDCAGPPQSREISPLIDREHHTMPR